MVIVILILLGLCFGSFVNAFVWRLRRQEEIKQEQVVLQLPKSSGKSKKKAAQLAAEQAKLSISKGRSMCVHCHHELAPKDLIPVVSFVLLRGKCRYCRKPIPDTPLSELVTPLLFVLSFVFWPLKQSGGELAGAGLLIFCFWLVFLVGFVALSIYDIRWFELPHKIVLPLIGLALLQTGLVVLLFDAGQGGGLDYAMRAFWGGLVGGGLFFLLYRFSPKQTVTEPDGTSYKISAWIGGGDITLGLLLGLLVGGPGNALLLIFVASLLGTLVAVPLLLAGRATRASHLPFGPYLIVAAIIVMLVGERLIDWYLGQFTA